MTQLLFNLGTGWGKKPKTVELSMQPHTEASYNLLVRRAEFFLRPLEQIMHSPHHHFYKRTPFYSCPCNYKALVQRLNWSTLLSSPWSRVYDLIHHFLRTFYHSSYVGVEPCKRFPAFTSKSNPGKFTVILVTWYQATYRTPVLSRQSRVAIALSLLTHSIYWLTKLSLLDESFYFKCRSMLHGFN